MGMKYRVSMSETYQTQYEVEAASEAEARAMAEEMAEQTAPPDGAKVFCERIIDVWAASAAVIKP